MAKDTMNHFYKQHYQTLFESLNTTSKGLSGEEATERLKQTGPNVLPHGKRVTFLMVVLHQFASPLIYVLIAAGIVSLLIREYEDAIFIFLIIFINAILGTYQEWRAEAGAAALQQLVKTTSNVLRDGEPTILDAELLVPGDIVIVESGMKVPADIRLISCTNLHSDEAILTGESLPIEKKEDTLPDVALPIGDQVNMLFAGTSVMSGRGQGVVVATALKTEIGMIAKSVAETKQEKTPLVKRMERFAMWVSIVVLVACIIIFIIGYVQGIPVIDIFFVAVAVAVSAIPEGLPIAMTVALSMGTSRMAKRNVIIRKLSAVEGLGSCNYIGTDKTGTLTVDQQTVKKIVLYTDQTFAVTGAGYNGDGEITDESGNRVSPNPELDQFIEAIMLCNEAQLLKKQDQWKQQGDAIDVAFLSLAYKYGKHPADERRTFTILKEIPFESERKYAAVFYQRPDGKKWVAAKGALESILEVCDGADNESISREANELASHGYRVLAVASGEVNETLELKGLSFLGLTALIDPLKPEAKDAVTFCHNGDIQVAMITGDHPATALAIAREVGLADSEQQVITGGALGFREGDRDEAYDKRIENITVFARVSPLQKQQIVAAVKARGNFVAVTGDGVNDAPALKTADIGVAMGYGSDVAKEASSIIITDNNFASLAAGIEEGRYTYGNLRKIIYLLISTGAAEIMMVFLALISGMPLPFLPVQLLWLNLVTNGMQDVALAFEKGEKYLLHEPPRDHNHGIFDRLMITQSLVAGFLMMMLTFGLWYHLLNNLRYEEVEARNIILLLMVLLQNFHVLNCRSERASIFSVPVSGNIFLWIAIIAAQGIHILSMHLPVMQSLLRVEPVSVSEWINLLATASIILVVMEVYKYFFVRKAKPKPHRLFTP